jgi:2-amino-4-hydroxy-6-hydroxymethyldihydropteridine diphosphokinase
MVHQANILTDSTNKCLIALGSNQPFEYIHSFELIKKAINYLADRKLRITGTSRFYQTPAFPKESGPDFVNAVVSADTKLCPEELIAVLHDVERALGRDRRKRWAPRTLDLDLIDFSGIVLPDLETYRRWADASSEVQQSEAPEQLILPHPRLQDRGFVLLPLRDVAPKQVAESPVGLAIPQEKA